MNTLDFGFAGLDRQLWELLLLSVRCGVAIFVAPMIGGLTVPVQARAFLGLAFALFIAIWMPPTPLPEMMSFAAILAVLQEVVIGTAMGIILQIAFAVPLIAAEQIAGTMGLAIATSIDPASGTQSGALGTYFSLIMTLLFFTIGGHLLWFELLIESYSMLPVGAFVFGEVRAYAIVEFMGYGIALSAAIGFPVVLVLLVTQLVTGMISRSAPALNLFALGLPAGVFAGIAALILAMPIVIEQFIALIEQAIRQSELLFSAGGAPPE